MKIDFEKCHRAMKQLNVRGTPRNYLIEEAIRAIQKVPAEAMRRRYFGIKNYAGFGDQREDHEYGFGPKHGTIVFSIGLTDSWRGLNHPLDTVAAVYYLEAYRDFKSIDWKGTDGRTYQMDLCAAIRERDRLAHLVASLDVAFDLVDVETHAAESHVNA